MTSCYIQETLHGNSYYEGRLFKSSNTKPYKNVILWKNPWKNITLEHHYSECDKAIILNPKYHGKLQIFDTLPEPYTGNINSNVGCLNGNASRMDPRFHHKEVFIDEMKDTMGHSTKEFMWLSEKLRPTDHWESFSGKI